LSANEILGTFAGTMRAPDRKLAGMRAVQPIAISAAAIAAFLIAAVPLRCAAVEASPDSQRRFDIAQTSMGVPDAAPVHPAPSAPTPYDKQPAPPAPALADSYAEELTDFGVPSQSELKVNVGSMTPLTIPGGRRVTTSAVFKLLDTDAILIDVLKDGGHLTLPGAIYMPGAGDPGSFRDRVQRKLSSVLSRLTFKNADRPLVFYCEGARCWESYNAALRAMQLGYRNVMWYRGGLGSWKEANLKMQPAAAIQELGN
jgi:PQQ-dependent catabolism-associated CXXCW motif protein